MSDVTEKKSVLRIGIGMEDFGVGPIPVGEAHPHGPLVLHSDYQSLESERDALKARVEDLEKLALHHGECLPHNVQMELHDRCYKAESDLAREKERNCQLERVYEVARADGYADGLAREKERVKELTEQVEKQRRLVKCGNCGQRLRDQNGILVSDKNPLNPSPYCDDGSIHALPSPPAEGDQGNEGSLAG